MATLEHVYDSNNLKLAWRRLRTNRDPAYKSYFRERYGNYAVADATLLDDLQDRLSRRVFAPAVACKLFFPKPSGILRPYTLLTVEDQIVYQAMVNIVADRLHLRVKHRYGVQVFGNLYAGRSSIWFYRNWKKWYPRFNRAARQAFAEGYRYYPGME